MRGSIPLLWSQKPNLKWQPDPSFKSIDEQHNCFRMHLNNLFARYGREALNGIPRKIVENLA
jgi:phosphatidylinositol 4-phosphatase